MAHILTNNGADWLTDALVGASVTLLLYNDATDNVSKTNNLADITTEPADGNYTRQTGVLERVTDGNIRIMRVSTAETFDTTLCSSQVVDSYAILHDPGTGLELMTTGALKQSYDLAEYDSIPLNVGDAAFQIP
jgi:hypothetical protein